MNPERLSVEQIQQHLSGVHDWSLLENPARIERTFGFKNYYETMAFVNAAAYVAHQLDHHPEMTFGYKTCLVSYSTHSAGGITELDFKAARELDGLYSS